MTWERKLKNLLSRLRKDEVVERFINYWLEKLEAEHVAEGIRRGPEYTAEWLANFLHFNNPTVRFIIMLHWSEISAYLSKVENVYKVLARKPEIKKLLDTPQGRIWLNKTVELLYWKLYNLVKNG